MTTVVLLAVLTAAIMHGAWNVIAKAIPDRLVSSSLIGLVYLVAGGRGLVGGDHGLTCEAQRVQPGASDWNFKPGD